MVRLVKSCLQICMKFVNTTIGLVGIAMILYSVWTIRVWQRDSEGLSPQDPGYSFPWFIHAFLGTGISLCAITCLGHIAADTANCYCLSCYMTIILLLLLIETAIIADILLNSHWEKDFPEDPSGRFDDFKDFVKSHDDSCKWIGLLIVLAQGISALLATVLRTLKTEEEISHAYERDNDFAPPRLPLLDHQVPGRPIQYVVGDPYFPPSDEAWKIISS